MLASSPPAPMKLMLLLLLALSWIPPGSCGKTAGLTGKGPLTVKQHKLKEAELELFWQNAPSLRTAEVARELRARRADYRAAHFDRPQGAVLAGGQSFCEREAVSKPVLKDYTRRVTEFRAYVTSELKRVLEPGDEFVTMLLEYMDELFFQGYPSPDGQKLIAALKHFYPVYQRGGSLSLSRAERALKGWSRHSLTRVRSPLPVQLLGALVGYMLHQGWTWAALALIIGFITYLRPGELLTLSRKHLIAPYRSAGLLHWSIIYRLVEDGKPTKSGEFEEAVTIDGPWAPWLNPILEALHRRLRPEQGLWMGLSSEQLIDMLRVAATRLNLSHLGVEWHNVRHGGASHDAVFKLREVLDIQKRLRHSSLNTVRRYEKSAKLASELRRADDEVVQFGQTMVDRLHLVFTQRKQLPKLPRCVQS